MSATTKFLFLLLASVLASTFVSGATLKSRKGGKSSGSPPPPPKGKSPLVNLPAGESEVDEDLFGEDGDMLEDITGPDSDFEDGEFPPMEYPPFDYPPFDYPPFDYPPGEEYMPGYEAQDFPPPPPPPFGYDFPPFDNTAPGPEFFEGDFGPPDWVFPEDQEESDVMNELHFIEDMEMEEQEELDQVEGLQYEMLDQNDAMQNALFGV